MSIEQQLAGQIRELITDYRRYTGNTVMDISISDPYAATPIVSVHIEAISHTPVTEDESADVLKGNVPIEDAP